MVNLVCQFVQYKVQYKVQYLERQIINTLESLKLGLSDPVDLHPGEKDGDQILCDEDGLIIIFVVLDNYNHSHCHERQIHEYNLQKICDNRHSITKRDGFLAIVEFIFRSFVGRNGPLVEFILRNLKQSQQKAYARRCYHRISQLFWDLMTVLSLIEHNIQHLDAIDKIYCYHD